ncbi:MAG: nucleoside deaminase [Opitutales bacterium]|nr:nucleoside deaminase [Opitutales bacterium]
MVWIPPCPFAFLEENLLPKPSKQDFMRCAYNEALKAWECGEIPVGAVAVVQHSLIARAGNAVETQQDATAHAEMNLIRMISNQRHDWRLADVTLYVTKEPCPMCSGAILRARIPTVVVGAWDPLQGCLGGRIHFNQALQAYHQISVEEESLQGACEQLLTTFFSLRRQQEKNADRFRIDPQQDF